VNLATAQGPAGITRDGVIEIVLTPTLEQYGEMGMDLEQARRSLGLPKSASKTEVIHAALRCAANSG